MLKTISAALLAASVLVVAPAMAHGPGRTAHGAGTVYVHPGVFGANARMGHHHYRHHHHRHHHKHFRHHHRFHGHR